MRITTPLLELVPKAFPGELPAESHAGGPRRCRTDVHDQPVLVETRSLPLERQKVFCRGEPPAVAGGHNGICMGKAANGYVAACQGPRSPVHKTGNRRLAGTRSETRSPVSRWWPEAKPKPKKASPPEVGLAFLGRHSGDGCPPVCGTPDKDVHAEAIAERW